MIRWNSKNKENKLFLEVKKNHHIPFRQVRYPMNMSFNSWTRECGEVWFIHEYLFMSHNAHTWVVQIQPVGYLSVRHDVHSAYLLDHIWFGYKIIRIVREKQASGNSWGENRRLTIVTMLLHWLFYSSTQDNSISKDTVIDNFDFCTFSSCEILTDTENKRGVVLFVCQFC